MKPVILRRHWHLIRRLRLWFCSRIGHDNRGADVAVQAGGQITLERGTFCRRCGQLAVPADGFATVSGIELVSVDG